MTLAVLRRAPQPLPRQYRRRYVSALVAFGLLAALVGPQLATSRSNQYLLNLWLIYAIAALGFYWMFALGGRFALCQTFMMALGGFVSATVTDGGSRPFLLGVGAALVATAAVAGLVGWLLRKAQAFYFAIGTYALAQIGTVVLQHASWIGGHNGARFGIAPPQLFGREFVDGADVYWLFLGILLLCLAAAAALERSPARRAAIAARDNPTVAALAGVRAEFVPLVLFMLGSALGGLSGALMAHWQGSVSVASYGIDLGIGILLMLLIGGIGSVWGPVAGAAVYVALPRLLSGFSQYSAVVYGVLLLICVVLVPDGLAGAAGRLWRALEQRYRSRREVDQC